MTILLAAAMTMASLAAPDPAQVIGMVVRAEGTWCDVTYLRCEAKDFKGLWRMYRVRRDSKLVRAGGHLDGKESIVIRSRWGALTTFDCANPRELGCKDPLNLSRLVPTTTEGNVVTAFFDAVLELASDRPSIYDGLRQGILRTRGAMKQLSDGVAELRGGGLNLETILRGWSAGEYFLQLCPLDEAANANCPDQGSAVKYSWDPKQPAPFPAGALRPGAYRLYFCEKGVGLPVRTENYADLIVAEEARYRELAADYSRVLDATRDWDSADPTAPALRRGYLYALARR